MMVLAFGIFFLCFFIQCRKASSQPPSIFPNWDSPVSDNKNCPNMSITPCIIHPIAKRSNNNLSTHHTDVRADATPLDLEACTEEEMEAKTKVVGQDPPQVSWPTVTSNNAGKPRSPLG